MDISHDKEQFSVAYVTAVASVAGFSVDQPKRDLDSIDMVISGRSKTGKVRSPRLELQLKCTASSVVREDVLKFPLKRKNFDDLIPTNVLVPRILVVVIVPEKPSDWLHQSEQELALRHCGYWVSLRGHPETENEASVTVDIPRNQVFSVSALLSIMARIEGESLP